MRNKGDHGKNASDGNDALANPCPSNLTPASERLLPRRGDYHALLSFQKAEVVYDITFRFVHKFLSPRDRTMDQMIQSARSRKRIFSKAARQR
jgi:hypothetical protein